MSLMDPLLKSVKFLIQEFHSVGEVVTDDNVYLDKFCNTVEQCFVKGIKQGKAIFKVFFKEVLNADVC